MFKSMLQKAKSKKGFTLMEMLIVVAIIAILVVIAFPTFNNALTSAKKAADDANIRAGYAEYKVAEMTAIADGAATAPSKDDYGPEVAELQHYASVNRGVEPWVGVPKSS